MQHFTFLKNDVECNVELPASDAELLPGIEWGEPCALFTPAYWYTQYLMRISGDTRDQRHRIGSSFAEELTACILGGHGVAAEVGLAVFDRLRSEGLISELCIDRELLQNRLREPLSIRGRMVRYRFWRQKAKYLAAVYAEMRIREFPTTDNALTLRNALMLLPGIGPKTASWAVRNWLGSDEVAILDIHIVRAGILANLFTRDDDVTKHYVRMEKRFVAFARALGVPTSDLDALIWATMRTTPRLVTRLLDELTMSD